MIRSMILASVLIFCACSTVVSEDIAVIEPSQYAIPATDEGLPGAGPIRRYEWFQNLWKNRRAGWGQSVQQDQGAVVFLGDSIMQGWGNRLEDAFPGVKVANRGISGDTSRGVLIRLEEDVFSVNPSAVILLIGTNDIEEKASPEIIASNVQLILEEINKFNSDLPIIFCDVMPSSTEMSRPSEVIQELNKLYGAILNSFPQIKRLDTFELFDNGSGDADPNEFPDLLHPNESAYAKWAAALRPLL